MSIHQSPVDVAVIGAGAAGLQAAQTLGRMRRRTLVLGSGRYRNDPAAQMHNMLGHDGTPPAALREAARADAARYPDVAFLEREVVRVEESGDGFTLHLAAGDVDGEAGSGGVDVVRATRVLLATGVTDGLPPVPGLAELFGDLVAHCPFCHGYEFAGTPVGILGPGPQVTHLAGMLAPIASRLVVLADGGELDDAARAVCERLGAQVHDAAVRAAGRGVEGGLVVDLTDGSTVDLGGLFVRTQVSQAASFAAQLGLELDELGMVLTDPQGRTSRPGVYAAGDLAHVRGIPSMPSVLTAAAAGMAAAAACVQDAAASAPPAAGRVA